MCGGDRINITIMGEGRGCSTHGCAILSLIRWHAGVWRSYETHPLHAQLIIQAACSEEETETCNAGVKPDICEDNGAYAMITQPKRHVPDERGNTRNFPRWRGAHEISRSRC